MARHRDGLPRLSIAPPLSMQQPMAQSLYSPALPTSLQQSFHPPFPVANPLQTPMQTYFMPQPPPAPGRPTHHQGQLSIAQLAAAGIHPPNQYMTPVTGHFPRPSLMLAPGQSFGGQQPSGPPYPNRHRKQLSIGGPPKAVLGGPARKLSPLPPTTPSEPAPTTPAILPKTKKKVVNLPKETVTDEETQTTTRPSWARAPLDSQFVYKDDDVPPVETSTAEEYPPEQWRLHLPPTMEIFLPGKLAWDEIKKKMIEEKLVRLGVERGSGSNVPHIHAPHARAASISSPADPALLLFRLNKLQQSQEGSSAGNSLSNSPQPPFGGLSSSPHQPPRFMNNRHGHTMSLAQPPTYETNFYDQSTSPYNPFAIQNNDIEYPRATEPIYAPQGRVPVTVASLAPPLAVSRPNSRPDFNLGFGLDIPEEEEPEEEEVNLETQDQGFNDRDATLDMELDEKDEEGVAQLGEGISSSRHHSRHVSRLSAAMSLRSLTRDAEQELEERLHELSEGHTRGLSMEHTRGLSMEHTRGLSVEHTRGLSVEHMRGLSVEHTHGLSIERETREVENAREVHVPGDEATEDMELEDVVGEWTGSEDVYLGEAETSDDESIGEWSNPSDEERARQARVERRIRRKAASQQQVDKPRRLPNFPRPPASNIILAHRDDDMISNPSDEGRVLHHHDEYLGVAGGDYYTRPSSSGSVRPLPPLPHSRAASGQYSAHDPAQAHSRTPSDRFVYPSSNHHSAQPSLGRRESLNPFAKPFVFGAPLESKPTWEPFGGAATPPNAPLLTHSRLPSLGKPLNVAAPEFKPTGFTFRPPAGVPQMPQPQETAPEFPRPVSAAVSVAEEDTSPFKVQGREKRQRRGSTASLEEGDTMSSFKFPPDVDSPRSIRRTSSFSGSNHRLNPSAEPFTFAGFSVVANSMPHVPQEQDLSFEQVPDVENAEETYADESTAKGENGEAEPFTFPSASKPKRAPIPLDFKHPVSSNTVPAGLFKALVNGGDERTRRAVRSRLSSREIYEHTQRPSMDDTNMPLISHNLSRGRLVTDPGTRPESPIDDDVFGGTTRHSRRRSSLPDALYDDNESSVSRGSVAPQDLTTRMEMHQLESILASLLDEKFGTLHSELSKHSSSHAMETMIADVVSLFRAQLQDSASRSLEDSQMDARGEMDFQLIKDVVEEAHRELLGVMRQELQSVVQRIPREFSDDNSAREIVPLIEQVGNRTIGAVIEAISELSARQEAVNHIAPARERDAIVEDILNALGPTLTSLRSDPVDYDFLTSQLTQAVKPHISQLIDLASDKRETAGLIVDRILPLLPSLQNTTIDTDAISLKLTTEVRRAIAPIDAFEIKEQVADLVVERLDSRLAVRDKAFNVDTVTGKVTEAVSRLLEPLQDVQTSLDKLSSTQESISSQHIEWSGAQSQILNAVSDLPSRLDSQFEALGAGQLDILAKLEAPSASVSLEPDKNVLEIKTAVEELSIAQKARSHHDEEIISLLRDTGSKINSLPESLTAITNDLSNSIVELTTSRDASQREVEELRKLNTEYQIQVTKARGAHGLVRVEKDVLNEKLAVIEGERDRLRNQVKELQTAAATKATETVALEGRNSELEDALAKALARLQSSDVASQANQKLIVDLEKSNKELLAEKQAFKSKVDTLELQVTFANRDKETGREALEVLQKQHERLQSQQSHWDDLRQASEKIDMLTNLIGQADNEELKELRRYRDRSKMLEGEHTVLQKRYKDLESKAQNSDRAATTSRQSLAQAQQRSAEWERRAKEYEGQLELTRTKLDQAEQTQSQLDADYSLVKLQLEEREADDRLAKDRENQLRDQITALESKNARLESELEQAKPVKVIAGAGIAPYRNITNGNTHPPPRPDSRASTIYNDRSVTPNRRMSSYTSTDRSVTPESSVWDSMHAPANTNVSNKYTTSQTSIHAPKGRYPHLGPRTPKARPMYSQSYRPASIPSPTPSTVSVAPTLGDDGWYS